MPHDATLEPCALTDGHSWRKSGTRPNRAKWLPIVLICGLFTAGVTFASGAARAGSADDLVIDAKVHALTRLLDSKAARQIDLSESTQGRAMLNEARVLFDWAQTELYQGQTNKAEVNMNEALRLVSRALVLVSWQKRAKDPDQRRYIELNENIAVYRNALGRAPDDSWFAENLDKARDLADRRKFREALPHLEIAYGLIERAVVESKNNATVLYTKKFLNSKEEFMYESGRYAGYRSLITQLSARAPERVEAGSKLIAESKRLHARALRLAGAAAVDDAIGLMEEANRLMGRAAKRLGAL